MGDHTVHLDDMDDDELWNVITQIVTRRANSCVTLTSLLNRFEQTPERKRVIETYFQIGASELDKIARWMQGDTEVEPEIEKVFHAPDEMYRGIHPTKGSYIVTWVDGGTD